MTGPTTLFSEQLHAEKYRSPGETFREAMNRIASVLSDSDEHYHQFRESLLEMRFLPAGRVQTAMGSTKNVTPYNCFVSGTIEDSFVDGGGSIMQRAMEAAATMRMGGGIGYDFSTLRPRGATIKKLQSRSSGPIAFMGIYDAICRCVASSGHRRGAQMGVIRVDHPDIEEFIHCKQNSEALTGFNISIAVTDQFMQCVELGQPFPLKFGHELYKEVDAQALWENIMRSTWDWAEPGVLFIDAINRKNNLAYCETIAATNPCGEQPLPPHGACLLGSFNLTRYLTENTLAQVDNRYRFDWDQFIADIPNVVRAMDNIIDKATYPLYEQEKEAKSKRRMGLGITGLANTGEALGHPYGSSDFVQFEEDVLRQLNYHAYRSSVNLAQEKGPFPLFDAELYGHSQFLRETQLLDHDELGDDLLKHGIRNSHLTSVAPTGTISMTADNVSSGIEPVFSYEVDRVYIGPDGPESVRITDYGCSQLKVNGRVAEQVTVEEHMAVFRMASSLVDSSVSKTCNVPSTTKWTDFKQIYMDAWNAGTKGCTTYQVGGKREGILKAVDQGDNESAAPACFLDGETGRRECE